MKKFLSVITIFKNETMIIKEWIEHHLWQGVEHFYLIDNGSSDDYLDVIKPYMDKSLISLYVLPEQHKQIEHYNTVYNKIKNETEWLAIIDVDEYLYCTSPNMIMRDIIKTLNFENIIRLYWYRFGSSGFDKQPEEIRTSFVMRFNDVCKERHQSKSIIKTSSFISLGIHKHQNIKNLIFYNNNDILRINHYQIMSKEYFEKIKMVNGDVFDDKKDNIRTWDYFDYRDKISIYMDTTLSDLVKKHH